MSDELEARRTAAAVEEYRQREALLIRTIDWLTGERPDLQQEASRRIQLRVIKGGRQ